MTRPHVAPPNRRARRAWRRGDTRRAIQATIDGTARQAAETRPAADEFEPTGAKADFFAAFSTPYVSPGTPQDHGLADGVFLYAGDGTLVRRIEGLSPGGWLKHADRIAVDRQRDRAYVSDGKRVVALDRDGRVRFDREIDSVQALAVDETTGDLWCICLGSLTSGWTIVLDEAGERKNAFPAFAFTLRYSSARDAFWFVGKTARLVARDGSVLAEHELPQGAYTLSAATIDSAGDCWALESSHPDVPESRDRVWKLSRDEAKIVDESFAYDRSEKTGTMSKWVEAVGDEVWVGYSNVRGEEGLPRREAVRRYARDGSTLGELDRSLDLGAATQDGHLWGFAGDRFLRIDANGDAKATVEHGPERPEGVYQNVWIGAFE